MGQHKHNLTAQLAKNGELNPKPKKVKPSKKVSRYPIIDKRLAGG